MFWWYSCTSSTTATTMHERVKENYTQWYIMDTNIKTHLQDKDGNKKCQMSLCWVLFSISCRSVFFHLSYRKIPGDQCEGGFQPERKETNLRRMCTSNALNPNSLVSAGLPENSSYLDVFNNTEVCLRYTPDILWLILFIQWNVFTLSWPSFSASIRLKMVRQTPLS